MSDKFLDTNIIIYSLGNDLSKRKQSIELISQGPVVSVQVLNETANILFKKFSMPIADVQNIIKRIAVECIVKSNTVNTHFTALAIKAKYRFSLCDSLIIAAALESNCSILYSEDMQHGQVIDNQIEIINPFKEQSL
ncbi:MAG: PIN domain-containing protein [Gammaproteobacteria bacterium]